MLYNINLQRKDKLESIIYLEYIRDMKTSKVFNEYSNKDKKFILEYAQKTNIGTEIEWCANATK